MVLQIHSLLLIFRINFRRPSLSQREPKMFDGLKLISAAPFKSTDPVTKRRERLVMQIDNQLRMCDPENIGRPFRGRWWSTLIQGGHTLEIRYAKTPLELSKGKHAIACETAEALRDGLQKARSAAVDGHFDKQLAIISEAVKLRFAKNAKS